VPFSLPDARMIVMRPPTRKITRIGITDIAVEISPVPHRRPVDFN
jgi:hypothetical protein